MAGLERCTIEECLHVGVAASGIECIARGKVSFILDKGWRGGVVGLL